MGSGLLEGGREVQESIICEFTFRWFEGNPWKVQMHSVAVVEVLACITLPKLIIVTSRTAVIDTHYYMYHSQHVRKSTPNSQCQYTKLIPYIYALKNPAPYGTPVDMAPQLRVVLYMIYYTCMYILIDEWYVHVIGYPTHHYHSNTYMYSIYII